MLKLFVDYETALTEQIEILALAEQHDPEFDEENRAELALLNAIREYDRASQERRDAIEAHEADPTEANSATYLERLDRQMKAGENLTAALKKMNKLQGKKVYTERDILGVRWIPEKGRKLPLRF